MASKGSPSFSLKEAAVLASLPEDRVRRELEHQVIDPGTVWVGKSPRRVFGEPEVSYLTLLALLGGEIELSRSLRTRIYRDFVAQSKSGKASRRIGPVVTIDCRTAARQARHRMALYRRGRDRIARDDDILGGEPVFAGTRLSVRHVGAMALGGEPVERIRADYPYLTEEDIAFAALFAEANPLLGRPKARDDRP